MDSVPLGRGKGLAFIRSELVVLSRTPYKSRHRFGLRKRILFCSAEAIFYQNPSSQSHREIDLPVKLGSLRDIGNQSDGLNSSISGNLVVAEHDEVRQVA